MMPIGSYPRDSGRSPASRHLSTRDLGALESGLRSSSTVPTWINEQETYLYDHYYRGNHLNRRTDPNAENFYVSQTDFHTQHGLMERAFFDTMHSANNCEPGVPAQDALRFRDYSETPYVHDGSRVYQREISEARDQFGFDMAQGGFEGPEQPVTATRAGINDKKHRHRQAREVDYARRFSTMAPIVGVNEWRQEVATHTFTPLADRQTFVEEPKTAWHSDNHYAGVVEF